MKKSTLIRIISLVLTSLFVLSLASCFSFGNKNNNTASEDDSEKVTIYLDPNGGTLPEGESDEIEMVVGDKMGKLPTPVRPGYTFLGWFEDGDERYEVDRKTEVEDYDMDIVALWEAAGELYAVEFTVKPDETLVGDVEYVEVVENNRISSVLSSLPTATRDGYKFKGWQDQNKNLVTATTKVTADLVLSATWERIVYCNDGTENHQWNAWIESDEATCTTPAQSSRQCSVCGHTEYNVTQEALGHAYGDFEIAVSDSGSMVRSRVCTECGDVDTDPLKNITFEKFNTPVIDGDVYGGDKGANLIDNNFTDTNMCGKGSGAVTVTLTAKEATYVDVFTVTGQGRGSYTVTVTYADGTEKTLGIGAFGSGATATKPFTVEAEITKVVIFMENPANGTDYWSELCALVINK